MIENITLASLADSGGFLTVKDGVVVAGRDATPLKVIDRARGRIALQTPDGGFVSVGSKVTVKKVARPGDAETFQWVDLHRGEILLLSLSTHRYIVAPSGEGAVSADHPGPSPDRKDGSCFTWKLAKIFRNGKPPKS